MAVKSSNPNELQGLPHSSCLLWPSIEGLYGVVYESETFVNGKLVWDLQRFKYYILEWGICESSWFVWKYDGWPWLFL